MGPLGLYPTQFGAQGTSACLESPHFQHHHSRSPITNCSPRLPSGSFFSSRAVQTQFLQPGPETCVSPSTPQASPLRPRECHPGPVLTPHSVPTVRPWMPLPSAADQLSASPTGRRQAPPCCPERPRAPRPLPLTCSPPFFTSLSGRPPRPKLSAPFPPGQSPGGPSSN